MGCSPRHAGNQEKERASPPIEPAGLIEAPGPDTSALVNLSSNSEEASPAKQVGAYEPASTSDDYTAIADTGAGATVGSVAAFVKQGADASQIKKRLIPMAKPRPFVTANGQVTSNNTLEVKTQGIGSITMNMLDTTCPLAVSVGEEVNKGYAFVWSRKNPPFFAREKHVRVTCPKTKRHEAAFARHNVPHFKIGISDSPIGSPPLHSPSGSRGGGSHFYTSNMGILGHLTPLGTKPT